jgi:hypothetical protein
VKNFAQTFLFTSFHLKGLVHDIQGDEKKSSQHLKEALLICQYLITLCLSLRRKLFISHRKQNFYDDIYRCQYNLADLARRHDDEKAALDFVRACIKTAHKMNDRNYIKEASLLRGLVSLDFTQISICMVLFPPDSHDVRRLC